MRIERSTPLAQFVARMVLLLFPTALVVAFLLQQANQYFSILQSGAWWQLGYFSLGMVASALVYSFRFRFLPLFLVLALVLYLIYKGVDASAVGEFDTFFISVKVLTFSTLLLIGWLVGWAFTRWRYAGLLLSSLLLVGCILLIAKINVDSVTGLLRLFIPILVYSWFVIYATEQIYQYRDRSQNFAWFLFRRLGLFLLLLMLVTGGVVYFMRAEIKETVEQYGGSGKEGDNSMLQRDKNGDVSLKNKSSLGGGMGRNQELLFVAKIDNYFEDSGTPNPLYLTSFYYSVFDTATETFERDDKMPYNDVFQPDLNKIPLYKTLVDSSVVKNSLGKQMRKTIEIEVYSRKLSKTNFVAPYIGYFVQPIVVDKDFRNEFAFAYRAKSYSSELNSAYFVYNSENPIIRAFQESRTLELQKVKSFDQVPLDFMQYYTRMPGGVQYDSIITLAQQLKQKSGVLPIDNVLAIRDHFLAKNEAGEPTFSYSDNPGVPDIPSARKLIYFLFDSKKGYCAYYAGATLFLLRAMGIPARIAVGFITVDRSDKNKGWYWYYADQAHAWVQVYFPGYGWIDFDTTVGNREAQESPKPDGTPPMQPSKAWLAAEGKVLEKDTVKKTLLLQLNNFIFHDKDYLLTGNELLRVDVSKASLLKDSVQISLSEVPQGDVATVLAFNEQMKNLSVGAQANTKDVLAKMPKAIPVDEVLLKNPLKKESKQKPEKRNTPTFWTWGNIAWLLLVLIVSLAIIILFLPSLFYQYYKWQHRRSRNEKRQAYFGLRAIHFAFHQMGIEREEQETALQYAKRVDKNYDTSITNFTIAALHTKYSKQALTAPQKDILQQSPNKFYQPIRSHFKRSYRLSHWINPRVSLRFWVGRLWNDD